MDAETLEEIGKARRLMEPYASRVVGDLLQEIQRFRGEVDAAVGVSNTAEKMPDSINHPAHYTKGKIEVIDFIQDQKMSYEEGNVTKYICRYKMKNGIEDLLKARWYLNRLIEKEEEL